MSSSLMVACAISSAENGIRLPPNSSRSTGTDTWMKFSQRAPPEMRQVSSIRMSNLPYVASVIWAA